jgi:hypothetical protein
MQETVQAFLGAVAVLLAGVLVVGALAMLVVAEAYYLAGFWIRLYWRCKECARQVRRDAEGGRSGRDQPGRRVDRLRASQPDSSGTTHGNNSWN